MSLVFKETLLNLVFIIKIDALGGILSKLDQSIFIWVCKARVSISKRIIELRKIGLVLFEAVLGSGHHSVSLKAVELVLGIFV